MKKIIYLFALSLLAFHFSLFNFVSPVSAKVIMQEKGTVTIPAGEVLDDDLFVVTENFELYGTVNGDVFVGAGTVKIAGNIKGGLFAGTGDLNLLSAVIGDSVVTGAGNIDIDKSSKIGGSLVAGAGNLANSATVGRNLMIGAGTIYLDGKVGKEARLGAGKIELGPSTNIAGNLTYTLGEDESKLTQHPSATIAGTVSYYTEPSQARKEWEKARTNASRFGHTASRGWLIVSFLGSLLIGFIVLKLFPKTFLGLSSQVKGDLLHSLGIGFLIIILTLPVLLLVSLTIVGLPLAGSLLLLLCLSLHLAKLAVSYALGRFIAEQFSWNKMGVYATYFVGLAIFYILRSLPPVGWVASFLFTWTGLGAIWIYTRSHLKNL